MRALARRETKAGFEHIKPILRRVVDQIEARYEAGGALSGLPSGLAELDAITGGFEPGDLVVLGARPSMGKTALATSVAAHAAAEAEIDVAIVSLEMPATQLASRMLASMGVLDLRKFRSGQFADDDWHRITCAVKRLADLGLHIDDTPTATAGAIAARVRALAEDRPKLGLVIVDHIQLVTTDARRNRAETVGETSRAMKILARELNLPIVVLAQLNRNLEQRPNKRPIQADLRDSGGIEQDADLVLFIYRDEIYNEDSPDKGTAELIVAKQRNGPIGSARVAFDAPSATFRDLPADWAPIAELSKRGPIGLV
ncbi:MAG: replicative DNA helicase [bacterium]|nr:replicative DNA helicase [bacterium]